MMTAVRVPVFVPDVLIADAAVPLPALGQKVSYALEFVETAGEGGPDFTVAAEAYAMPDDDTYLLLEPAESGPAAGPARYPTVVHGPAWAAKWAAPAPHDGPASLLGELRATFASLAPADARIRGTIMRVAVVTESVDTSDPDALRWRADPRRRIREVDTSPVDFANGLVKPAFGSVPVHPNPWRHEVGVVVEIEADPPG